MLKISTKISLLYFAATAVIIAIMASSTYFIYQNQRLKAIDDELYNYAQFLTSGHDFNNLNLEEIFRKLTDRRDNSKGRLKFNYNFILIGSDTVIYESDERLNLDLIISDIMEFDEKHKKDDHATISVSDRDYRIYEDKLRKDRNLPELDIIMVASLDKFYESLKQITYILFIVSPLLLIIAALIGYYITRRALNPVRQITRTAESISGKNLDGRVPISRAEDELSQLARTFNDMIDRLQKTINSQKQFIADASHDFRTPLSIIRLELELLLQNPETNERTRKSIDKSIRQIKSLSSMAENLLLLARADAKQLKLRETIFRLDELIVETVSGFNKLASDKKIKFQVNIPEAIELSADFEMIKRVLNNALDNAVKYSHAGKNIKIELEKDETAVLIRIINHGNTLTPEELDSVFARFQRNDKARTSKGFGLGMPIIKTIVEAHNGKVDLASDNNVNILTISFNI